ncbi:DNA repair protein (XPGC)/ Rad [Cordyceps fumosorosea ARSEF 2679]|uniref:DNA repair protein (XPGC)/ Rad n=1 Tax=Cordyceps fumosorosea (strain ARSEF 2679) TaxID=1081104 RepID=A0A162LNT1_CORFA|nr:DNA repair protein (XPGC)/ Rad [Cordyceps fumosorosea ARSEF 2679]OAA73454.1 DNA repair protein (XPGC)/ Rad [Cordyceps fumosorosea ARSEF 2679]
MGVSGLLPLLKSIQKPTELKKCDGQTLGVDAYGWLHRAAFCCAVELGQGKPTTKYVTAAMHRVRMLLHFGVKPYMVFDGDYLPSKAATELSRAKNREEKKKLADDLMKAGKPGQAAQEFQKCVDVTPEMAATLIQELKKMDIPCIVAPYEADAQLVYLEKQGLIDGILSDDSDLLVFGAKRLLTKLDKYGNCIEIKRRDFAACREVSLTGWSDTEFRRMAIMSGCDYLNGLPGVGLKTAYRLMRKSKSPERVVRMLQFDGKRVSENYLTQFYQAELTFLHQWVFCPTQKTLVHLTELDGSRTAAEMPFIGAFVEPDLARGIATGDVNPITKERFTLHLTPSKRKLGQTKSYSAAPVATQPPRKPITSFFKTPSRRPMGEMDPNCFSVDAERVAQLTEGGLVPRVFPLPRPYIEANRESSNRINRPYTPQRISPRLNRRRTDTLGNLVYQTASSPLFTRPKESNLGGTVRSEPQRRPQKKLRLCDETEPIDTSPKTSRFFSAETPSAAVKKAVPAKTEGYLFSDDSVEDALKDLPDIDSWEPRARNSHKKMLVFEDDRPDMPSQSTSYEASSLTEPSTSQTSQPEKVDTSGSSMEPPSMPPPKQGMATSQQTKTPACTSLSRFSYTSTSSSSRTLSTPASGMSAQSSIFSSLSTPSTTASSVGSMRMTPLQRLGARAADPLFSPNAAVTRRRAVDNGNLSATPGKELAPRDPTLVPLPKVDVSEVEALHAPCGSGGSEDQLVPDSDGEDDEEFIKLPPGKRFNPLQFTFR